MRRQVRWTVDEEILKSIEEELREKERELIASRLAGKLNNGQKLKISGKSIDKIVNQSLIAEQMMRDGITFRKLKKTLGF